MLELFSGSGIMSKTFKENGHEVYTIDNNKKFNPDLCVDIMKIEDFTFVYSFDIDVFWASVPCTCFSVASISKHWKGGKRAYIPKSSECWDALELLEHTIMLIDVEKPKHWYIENPRGVMRKVIDKIFEKYNIKDYVRHTVTYCQYGDNRMKPTDIWTNNLDWKPRPMCKNGDNCHIAAPRGSRTGTQGLKNNFERSKLPKELCEEIVDLYKMTGKRN